MGTGSGGMGTGSSESVVGRIGSGSANGTGMSGGSTGGMNSGSMSSGTTSGSSMGSGSNGACPAKTVACLQHRRRGRRHDLKRWDDSRFRQHVQAASAPATNGRRKRRAWDTIPGRFSLCQKR